MNKLKSSLVLFCFNCLLANFSLSMQIVNSEIVSSNLLENFLTTDFPSTWRNAHRHGYYLLLSIVNNSVLLNDIDVSRKALPHIPSPTVFADYINHFLRKDFVDRVVSMSGDHLSEKYFTRLIIWSLSSNHPIIAYVLNDDKISLDTIIAHEEMSDGTSIVFVLCGESKQIKVYALKDFIKRMNIASFRNQLAVLDRLNQLSLSKMSSNPIEQFLAQTSTFNFIIRYPQE